MKCDKAYHFIAGVLLGFVFINMSMYYGFVVAVLISILKEVIWDKWMKKGTFEWYDMLSGIAGTSLIFLTSWIQSC